MFVTASSEPDMFIWDKRKKNPALKIEHKQQKINKLMFLRNGCFLSGGKTLKYWDIRNPTCQAYKYDGHNEEITQMCKVERKSDQKGERFMFATGGNSGEIFLWEDTIEFYHGAHKQRITDLSFGK